MKVRLFSEDMRDGKDVDWPVMPREGDFVVFHHQGGANKLKVDCVVIHVDTDGTFDYVEVDMVY